MPYAYILYSIQLDRYYIGHTDQSPEERILKHLSDHSGFTSKAKDWQIVFRKSFDSKAEAYKYECQIKSWKSRKRIINLISGV